MAVALSLEVIARVEAVEWFAAVGEPGEISAAREILVTQVPSVEEAVQLLSASDWEQVTAEASGRLTAWLHEHCRPDYQHWNELIRETKGVLERTALPAARSFAASNGSGDVLLDCVGWDVLHAVMEASYKRCQPPVFFADLLSIYEAGHLPCGWNGAWPDGQLLFV